MSLDYCTECVGYGDAGDRVLMLQRTVKMIGFFDGDLDGVFGTITSNAVKAFQTYVGINSDGVCGTATWHCLYDYIAHVQLQLKEKFGYVIEVDGTLGSHGVSTVNALIDCQVTHGLIGDGIIGFETEKLLAMVDFMNVPSPAEPINPSLTPVPAPIGNGDGKTICINAGHGGSDPGACGNLIEKDINLQVALSLGQTLSNHGFTVVQTRSTDTWQSLGSRPEIANACQAALFISIHHNGANTPKAKGTEIICYPGSSSGHRLAECVLHGMVKHLGFYQRGIIERDDSDVTQCSMPAIITEGCFMTNPDECHVLINGGIEREVTGIVEGILNYFNLHSSNQVTPAPSQPGGLQYFEPNEFSCGDGCGFDCQWELKEKLDRVRGHLGLPLIVSSGARCAAFNQSEGGVEGSEHTKGKAADIYTSGMTNAQVDEIARWCQKEGLGTIRYYDWSENPGGCLFVHAQLDAIDMVI